MVPMPEWQCWALSRRSKLAMGARLFEAAEAIGEVGAIPHGIELRLRVRVDFTGVRSAVALGDVQVDQQAGHRIGAHGRTANGVQREHPGLDIVPGDRLGDELLGQVGALVKRSKDETSVKPYPSVKRAFCSSFSGIMILVKLQCLMELRKRWRTCGSETRFATRCATLGFDALTPRMRVTNLSN